MSKTAPPCSRHCARINHAEYLADALHNRHDAQRTDRDRRMIHLKIGSSHPVAMTPKKAIAYAMTTINPPTRKLLNVAIPKMKGRPARVEPEQVWEGAERRAVPASK